MSWTNEQIVVLIESYKKHQCLYEVKNKNYHNKHIRNLALQEILQNVKKIRSHTSYAEIQKKFQGLRSTYAIERRTVLQSLRSGIGEDEVYKPGLWYYPKMDFLHDHMNIRKGISNFNVEPPTEGESNKTINLETLDDHVTEVINLKRIKLVQLKKMFNSIFDSQFSL
ncbi:hypothetical protein ABEB36_000289 [Hypothenemus hampei]|uniref:MADF domain-containing protein n=1 Tax=Hypothenemus hampei TaxID=57062 RepID=A0ABD1FAT4_HYPHA